MNFSIIITYKNKWGNEKYINNCLDSISNQTYNSYEVILVHNDKELIDRLCKNRELTIKEFKMSENDNISDYKNKAIKNASGEFLVFLDADDYLHPNALIYAQQMIEDKNESIDIYKFGISKTNLDKTATLSIN
ncbi:glycosyltransferase family A protein, partial [Staphylococcus succinus]|uniref:glycosyltransferase family A protein n=1 Tax=Staphylococcus succinus TaxID=61015 RepID=UPI000EC4A899